MGLAILGDLMLGRHQAPLIKEHGIEGILGEIKETIGKRKIIANLECPLIKVNKTKKKESSFSKLYGAEILAKQLSNYGFEALSLANNHIFDFGNRGLINTQKILNQNSIKFFGAGLNKEASITPAVLEVDKYTIAFLGFSFSNPAQEKKSGVAYLYDDTVKTAIKKVKSEVDFLIVMPHSGIELYQYPLKRDQKIYRRMIELGADLVVGSQSHCIQAMEIYLKKTIYYGIGDLLFDHFHKDTKLDFTSNKSHSKKFCIEPSFSLMQQSLIILIDIIAGKLVVKHETVENKDGHNPKVLTQYNKELWMNKFGTLNYNLKNSNSIEKERIAIEKKLLVDLKSRRVI
tara:strand:- start:5124 stop:6158 length:1035 start_codon:yes stop_codon:yes gene_type:complete